MVKYGGTLAFLSVALWAGAAVAADVDGKVLFNNMCATCHQQNGAGLPHYYPSLAGSPVVLGDDDKAVLTVLEGRDGMPEWAPILKDAEVAKILTYVRTSWGNDAPAIDAAKVAEVRKTISSSGFNMGN